MSLKNKFQLCILILISLNTFNISLFANSSHNEISITLKNSKFYIGKLLGYENGQLIICNNNILYFIDSESILKIYDKNDVIDINSLKNKKYPIVNYNSFSKTIYIQLKEPIRVINRKLGIRLGFGYAFPNHTYYMDVHSVSKKNSWRFIFNSIIENSKTLIPKENIYTLGVQYSQNILEMNSAIFNFGYGMTINRFVERGKYKTIKGYWKTQYEFEKKETIEIGLPIFLGLNTNAFSKKVNFSIQYMGNLNFHNSFHSVILCISMTLN